MSYVLALRATVLCTIDASSREALQRREEVYMAIVAAGGYEYAVAMLAVLALGAAAVPITPALPTGRRSSLLCGKVTSNTRSSQYIGLGKVPFLGEVHCVLKQQEFQESPDWALHLHTRARSSRHTRIVEPGLGRKRTWSCDSYKWHDWATKRSCNAKILRLRRCALHCRPLQSDRSRCHIARITCTSCDWRGSQLLPVSHLG